MTRPRRPYNGDAEPSGGLVTHTELTAAHYALQGKPLTAWELSALLHASPGMINGWRFRGLPCAKSGRVYYYDFELTRRWLARREITWEPWYGDEADDGPPPRIIIVEPPPPPPQVEPPPPPPQVESPPPPPVRKAPQPVRRPPDLLTATELCAALNISGSWFRNMRYAGMPYVKHTGRKLFSEEECRAWMRAHPAAVTRCCKVRDLAYGRLRSPDLGVVTSA